MGYKGESFMDSGYVGYPIHENKMKINKLTIIAIIVSFGVLVFLGFDNYRLLQSNNKLLKNSNDMGDRFKELNHKNNELDLENKDLTKRLKKALEFYPAKKRFEANVPYWVREKTLDIQSRLTDDDPTNDPIPAFETHLEPGETKSSIIKVE